MKEAFLSHGNFSKVFGPERESPAKGGRHQCRGHRLDQRLEPILERQA